MVGCGLLVYRALDVEEICFLNVYAPSANDAEFYEIVESELTPYVGVLLIWSGDFNCLLDGMLDQRPPQLGMKPHMVQRTFD
ncbi:hypothetical protein NDU88_004431 [Pleurodeles waltl]|uniref:Uncharacterized protein n=1 Tax=Pleurodeles waltl TaxID=8319 RepID=A0AAV7NJD4_PLEWA|nr:hypothetical protein NDU88_004431 [Pleurodeles waltl]